MLSTKRFRGCSSGCRLIVALVAVRGSLLAFPLSSSTAFSHNIAWRDRLRWCDDVAECAARYAITRASASDRIAAQRLTASFLPFLSVVDLDRHGEGAPRRLMELMEAAGLLRDDA